MKIFVNGDSHTCGSELYFPTQDGYAYCLANLLNGEIVGNPAIGGAGNDRIERTTKEFIDNCNGDYPDLIIIGWSEFNRMDWFYEGKLTTYVSNDLPPKLSEKFDPKRYKHEREFLNNEFALSTLSRYFQGRIYNFHCYLEHLKIPHLFFMAVDGLGDFTENLDGVIHHFDWNNKFWNPYEPRPNNSFLHWGKNKGYTATKWDHLPEEAHEEFANILYNHLLEHNIINS